MADERRKPARTYESLEAIRSRVERGLLQVRHPMGVAAYRTGTDDPQSDPKGILLVFADADGEPDYFCVLEMSLVTTLHDALAIEMARRKYHE